MFSMENVKRENSQGGRKKHYKDTWKEYLKDFNIPPGG